MSDLAVIYREYIDCLNRQDWDRLGQFVSAHVQRNGELLKVAGYRKMLQQNYIDIPDLAFNVELLLASQTHVASRLLFDCAPKANFLGLPVNGRRVRFSENVFYEFRDARIERVWSVIDKTAIESQLG